MGGPHPWYQCPADRSPATLTTSDNTAANLILASYGGPAALTASPARRAQRGHVDGRAVGRIILGSVAHADTRAAAAGVTVTAQWQARAS